jgi:HEAT repeat protein
MGICRAKIIGVFLLGLVPLSLFASTDLTRIKQTLADKSYGNYWDRLTAINKLKPVNSKEAAVMLVALFDDEEAPIRESALMTLGNFTDKEAVDYLVATALVNPQSKSQRFYTAWALGVISAKGRKDDTILPQLLKALNNEGDEEVAGRIIDTISVLPNNSQAEDILIKRLSDSRLAVRVAAIESLGRMGSVQAYIPILKRAYDSSPTVKIAALAALAQIKPQESAGYLESALKDQLPEVRIAAIETLTRYKSDKTLILKSTSDLLRDKNPAVRATAVQCLRELREKDSVKTLAERLPGASWRLRYDLITALKDLTGKEFGFDAKAWLNWYQVNKENIEIAPSRNETPAKRGANKESDLPLKSNETIPTFFDIAIPGRDIVFILDLSRSMKNEAEDNDDKKERKIDIAISELTETFKRFSSEARFNIIILSTEAARYGKRKASKTMLPATEENKKAALKFVNSLWDKLEDIKSGRGDHYDALIEALSEPEVDTVFLLSDGRPTYGTYINKDNIVANVARNNRFKKVVINTIITGNKGTKKDRELMEELAGMSNGVCVDPVRKPPPK